MVTEKNWKITLSYYRMMLTRCEFPFFDIVNKLSKKKPPSLLDTLPLKTCKFTKFLSQFIKNESDHEILKEDHVTLG